MWARMIELMLACWLAISPFVFGYAADATLLRATDYVCAPVVATAAMLSYHRRWQRVHLLHMGTALWMLGVAFSLEREPVLPAAQNNLIVALLLGMLAMVPSRAASPPRVWAAYVDAQDGR